MLSKRMRGDKIDGSATADAMPTASLSNAFLLLLLAASFTQAHPPHSDEITISPSKLTHFWGLCKIVGRDEWGARPARRINKRDPLSPFLLVHHGGIANYSSTAEGSAAIIRSYQDLHMDQRGWDDIGYSFLIGEDGRVYEGRGWDRVGAHAPQYNHVSIGVCFLGDFSERLPNAAALQALRDLITCSIGLNRLMANYTLLGHRQAKDTLCPGEALYNEITHWPHWKPNPSPRMYEKQEASAAASNQSQCLLLTIILTLNSKLLNKV